MAIVPAVPTFDVGVLNTTTMNQLSSVLSFLSAPPAALLRQTVAQSLTTATWVPITFTTEDFDTVNGHDNSTNPSRYTAVYAGRYRCSGAVAFAASATGRRLTKWMVNGSDVNGSGIYSPATAASVAKVPAATMDIYLNVGDYLELAATQESGGTINTAVGGPTDTSIMCVRWAGTA